MAVGGAGGIAADDLWQIIMSACKDGSRSSNAMGLPLLADFGGQLVHCMSSSLLCGGPDADADASLANR